MPSAELCWLEGRQQTGLIKLLLLPGGKMFQGIDPLCHLIGANDEGVRVLARPEVGKVSLCGPMAGLLNTLHSQRPFK